MGPGRQGPLCSTLLLFLLFVLQKEKKSFYLSCSSSSSSSPWKVTSIKLTWKAMIQQQFAQHFVRTLFFNSIRNTNWTIEFENRIPNLFDFGPENSRVHYVDNQKERRKNTKKKCFISCFFLVDWCYNFHYSSPSSSNVLHTRLNHKWTFSSSFCAWAFSLKLNLLLWTFLSSCFHKRQENECFRFWATSYSLLQGNAMVMKQEPLDFNFWVVVVAVWVGYTQEKEEKDLGKGIFFSGKEQGLLKQLPYGYHDADGRKQSN